MYEPCVCKYRGEWKSPTSFRCWLSRHYPPLAPPAATMILRLFLNEMVPRSSGHELSRRKPQPDGSGRILVDGRAAANLVNADGALRPGHLQHDPPLHPTRFSDQDERS